MSWKRRPKVFLGIAALWSMTTFSPALAAEGRASQPERLEPPSGKLVANSTTLSEPAPALRSRQLDRKVLESEKLAAYLIWLDRMEHERATLRDTGITASNATQAFEHVRSFERSTLTDRPPRPEKLLSGDRFYLDALTLEAKYTIEIIGALQAGESRRARKLAQAGSKAIDHRLARMRRELSWYYRQRKLGDPPVIAPSANGSYFGYLAGHAPH